MPFDGTLAEVIVGNLAIQSVPQQEVDDYKAKALKAYVARGPRERDMVNQGIAHWHHISFGTKFDAVKKLVTYGLPSHMTPDKSKMPTSILDVAQTVHENQPKTEFVVEYFYDDPILHAYFYTEDGRVRDRVTLGIWDQGEVQALATVRKLTPAFPVARVVTAAVGMIGILGVTAMFFA